MSIGKDGLAAKDLILLQFILSSKEQLVILSGVQAVRTLAKYNLTVAINLLKCVDISISSKIADNVLGLFRKDELIPFNMLTDEDIVHFLNKLILIPELNGYWIETFLSKVSMCYAQRAASFFMARVEHV